MEAQIRKIIITSIEIAGMMFLYWILDTQGMLKYFISTAIGIFILIIFYRDLDVLKEDWPLAIPVMIHCGLGLILSLFGGTKSIWTIKCMVFWIFPILFAYLICLIYVNDRKRMINQTFFGSVFAYLICNRYYFITEGYCESTFAFVFGLFILYYCWDKQWIKAIIAALCMHLANKRIAVLAVVACVVLMILMKVLKYEKKWISRAWISLMAVVGVYVYSIYSGVFMNLCIKLGIDTSHRLEVYPVVVEQIPDKYFFGRGLGTTNELLVNYLNPWLYQWFENPHNDFLKIFVDLGAIGLVLFMVGYLLVIYMTSKRGVTNRAASQLFVIFVYFMLLMTTDNVSIYILFLVPMYSICLALMGEKEELHENHAK